MPSRRNFLKRTALLGIGAAVLTTSRTASAQSDAAAPASGTDSNTYTVQMTQVKSEKIPPRKIDIPDTDGFKVLKGDFHIHTLFSDGHVMPKDRIEEAVRNGLDAIAVTDHIEYRPYFSKGGRWKLNDETAANHNISYETGKDEAAKQNLLWVRGTEITKSTMPPGHFNALFGTDNNAIAAVVDDWRTMLKVAADQGAFLQWNHPGWAAPKSGGIEPGTPLRFTDAHEEVRKQNLLHGIEIFNHNEHYPVVLDWCNERDLAVISNSDIHDSELNLYGIHNLLRPITLILAKERTVESLREAFFARRTIGWAAGRLWGRDPWLPALFKASVEIKTLTPGTLGLKNKSSLPITVSAGGMTVELIKDKDIQLYRAAGVDSLTVTNWLIGTNKPLEIAV